jgi:type IV pilus assembly protein PilX
MKSAFKQRGATLIIGLILLLVMSVVSLSSISSVTVQEKISANIAHRNQALQEAELTLLVAEKATLPSAFAYADYLSMVVDDPDLRMTDEELLNRDNWDCGKTTVAVKKRCIQLISDGPLVKFEYIDKTEDLYRITVRSEPKGEAIAIIQSVFKR